jgi:hypothetical protein
MTYFDGTTFDPALDGRRLSAQLDRVRSAMGNGGWWTLAQLASVVGGSEAGVSARIRDLRKAKFGGWQVDRRRVSGAGLWEYRLSGRAAP